MNSYVHQNLNMRKQKIPKKSLRRGVINMVGNIPHNSTPSVSYGCHPITEFCFILYTLCIGLIAYEKCWISPQFCHRSNVH